MKRLRTFLDQAGLLTVFTPSQRAVSIGPNSPTKMDTSRNMSFSLHAFFTLQTSLAFHELNPHSFFVCVEFTTREIYDSFFFAVKRRRSEKSGTLALPRFARGKAPDRNGPKRCLRYCTNLIGVRPESVRSGVQQFVPGFAF